MNIIVVLVSILCFCSCNGGNGTSNCWTAIDDEEIIGEFFTVWGSDNDVIVAGSTGNAYKAYYNNGSVWSDISEGLEHVPISLWGSSMSDLFAACQRSVVKYDGISWEAIGEWGEYHLEDIWGLEGDIVLAVGYEQRAVGEEGYSRILLYNGMTWSEVDNEFKFLLHGVWGISQSYILAVGTDSISESVGKIINFDGNSWQELDIGIQSSRLNSVWGLSQNDVFAVGDFGTILHFDGENWSKMETDSWGELFSVHGNSKDNVYAVGEYGEIYHYDGQAWRDIGNGIEGNLFDVWVSSDNDVYVVGWDEYLSGQVLKYQCKLE